MRFFLKGGGGGELCSYTFKFFSISVPILRRRSFNNRDLKGGGGVGGSKY